MITLVGQCVLCGEEFEVTIFEEDFLDWQNGKLIQLAMPYLSADEREMLMSGLCGKCQAKFFDQA